jgi:RNA polymerase sigma-70 factor, ECF subfamily
VGFASWDERELVRRCKEGSEAAYAELVRRHRPRLLGLAFRLTGSRDTAEDVVQEAFIAAFRAMERFEPKPAVAPWLNTITVRLAGRAASRRAAHPDTSLDRMLDPGFGSDAGAGSDGAGGSPGRASVPGDLLALADHSADPLAAVEAAEIRREVAVALDALPFKHRAAVVLRFVMGLEYTEAAQTLDIPLNTYKSHLLRGTRQLRDTLGPRLAEVAATIATTTTTASATAGSPDLAALGPPDPATAGSADSATAGSAGSATVGSADPAALVPTVATSPVPPPSAAAALPLAPDRRP